MSQKKLTGIFTANGYSHTRSQYVAFSSEKPDEGGIALV